MWEACVSKRYLLQKSRPVRMQAWRGPQVLVTAGKYKSEIHLVLARDLYKDLLLKLANHMNIEYTELTCLFANLAHHKCMADKYAMNS